MARETNQRTRLIVMFIYILLLLFANYLAFGSLLPLIGEKGLWFYCGISSVLLGSLLVTPFYTKPVDGISYAVVAIIALYSVSNLINWQPAEQVTFITTLLYFIFVIIISFITIMMKDSTDIKKIKYSNTFRLLSETLGNQSVIFSIVIVFAIIVFHRHAPKEMFIITFAWVITVLIRPDEFLIRMYKNILEIWDKYIADIDSVGEVVAFQTPGIVLIRQKDSISIDFGVPLLFRDHNLIYIVIPLDQVGRDKSILVRGIIYEKKLDLGKEILKFIKSLPEQTVFLCKSILNNNTEELLPELSTINNLVGIVSSDTSLDTLYFEVTEEKDLEEGKLVEVMIKNSSVLYQIIDGFTKEEIVYQKNTFGYAKAKARKIGIWNNNENKFVHATWLPKIYAPVYLKSKDYHTPEKKSVGYFPGTNYSVGIKNVDSLVTHNTAILGILGVGKSMLSIELVERMIAQGIKVICIDLTDQYAKELSDFYASEDAEQQEKNLCQIGITGKTNVKLNVEEGGSINQFSIEIKKQIDDFMKPENEMMLKIYNPSKFEVWRQDSKPFQGAASMAFLTPPQITQIISEAALESAQKQGMTDNAKVCLVYEEAHSLVPEWNSVVSDGDKSATNGSARAILQGRKYGLGCLLITQRTANVTKTILNQCNTIFAMRTFDDTGMNFLSNYIGGDYSKILSSLQERHAVFFGKASACENPVMIRLNDQDEFRSVFRN